MSLFPFLIIAGIAWLLYTLYLKKMLKQGKSGKLKIALIVLGLFFLMMAATGRAPALFAILGAAMTQVMRIAPLLIRYAPSLKQYLGSGNMPGAEYAGKPGVSQVATETLVMTLDLSTGRVDGEVITGGFQGRKLHSLTIAELQQLYQYCDSHDTEALRLLQTYITREKADEWQASTGKGPENKTGGSGPLTNAYMTRIEALQVLGITGDVTRKGITTAHRSLMGRFHPDKGGNDYLATKLNTARDVLLKGLTEKK